MQYCRAPRCNFILSSLPRTHRVHLGNLTSIHGVSQRLPESRHTWRVIQVSATSARTRGGTAGAEWILMYLHDVPTVCIQVFNRLEIHCTRSTSVTSNDGIVRTPTGKPIDGTHPTQRHHRHVTAAL